MTNLVLIAVLTVSYYCPCKKCCQQQNRITASGSVPREGITQLANSLLEVGDMTRDDVAKFIRDWDFGRHAFAVHVGGRHVAILAAGKRVAIVTGTGKDWL